MSQRHEKPLFSGNARVSIAHLVLPLWACQGFTRLLTVLTLATTLWGCTGKNAWHVEDVTGHLPDLDFSLVSDSGSTVTAKKFEGHLLLLYFGYTHCNAECPVSLARLAQVVQMLGDGNRFRILFVSLDPDRDTPEVLQRYIVQFDSERAVGLTGTAADIERLTKQYRTAYRPRSRISETADIEHGDAVYVFDAHRRARLIATSSDADEHLMKDLRRLVQEAYQEGALREGGGDRERFPPPD
jgi:protein SCO1